MEPSVEPIVVMIPPLPPLKETGISPWPAQGEWTYEDYLRLPDDGNRYEIIEGALYMVNAPGFDHQYTVMQLLRQISNFVIEKGLGVVLTAPFEVHLSERSRQVQPDILFIAAERMPQPSAPCFVGVPDLIVEILSPNTVRTDRIVKFAAYERAKVREYWIVDLGTRSVEVYVLGNDGVYALFGQFRTKESTRSAVLEGFHVAVDSLFA
ncbi:MAG: Uma2 family endonuclease [Anaerolineae bacterium]|nr:Uma2 family endonuclease [Anaerolineae bacterium]MDW8099148.1 Uma2 family endonuclease [Anaerolineae bacterium]